MTDTLQIKYVALDDPALSFWQRNPKQHDLGALIRSFERHGFKQPPRYEPTLNDGAGGIVAGNGRIEALLAMRNAGHDAPRGIAVQDGAWFVPVLFGVDAASQAAAEAWGVDDNNMVMAGGDFTAIDQARAWNANYLDLLQELAAADELPVSVDGDDLDGLIAYNNAPTTDEWGAALGGLPDGDRAPFQQMTFTVSDEQAEQVKEALQRAKHAGPFIDTGNENSNGNALARICEVFLGVS